MKPVYNIYDNAKGKHLYNAMSATFGVNEVIDKAKKEFIELIHALDRFNENKGNEADVIDELADAENCLNQLINLFDARYKVTMIKKKKFNKMKKLLCQQSYTSVE